MSAKDCGNHGHHKRHKLYRRLFACAVGFIVLVLFVILVVWLVLRPSGPKFYIQDTTVYQFNFSNPDLLTSTIQTTISSRNPNDRVGIYYDKLDVYAAYKNQQITAATALPTGYQGHNDVTIWSPYLYGPTVPVAPYVGASLAQDETAGYLLMYVKIEGRLRWKVGTWISGHYHIEVSCPAFFTVGSSNGGGPSSFRFQHISSCNVDV